MPYSISEHEILSIFDPGIHPGEVFKDKEINELFSCQPQKGIRSGRDKTVLVIISKTFDNPYPDKWVDDVLLYTGSDENADEEGQTLSKRSNNDKLFSAWEHPTEKALFLFESDAENSYTYKGTVVVCSRPYRERRSDEDPFLVWKFPLKLLGVDQVEYQEEFRREELEQMTLSIDELKAKIDAKGPTKAKAEKRHTTVYARDPMLSAYVKLRADGHCDICKEPAPFLDKNGFPYLESHHVQWLSKGGIDDLSNMVALCPNCHRRVHVLKSEEDLAIMNEALSDYETSKKV